MSHRILSAICLLVFACNCTAKAPGPGATASEPSQVLADGDSPVPADPREATIAAGILRLLASEHLRQHPVDDKISRKAFAEFLESSDPGKLFLLDSDVQSLNRFADKMDDQMQSGDLELARLASAALVMRQNEVAKSVEKLLAKPFDLTTEETVETDPDKRSWAKSEAELNDRWRKVLKLQVLERIVRMEETAEALAKAQAKGEEGSEEAKVLAKSMAKIPKTFAGKEERAREELRKSYAGRFKRLTKLEPLEPAERFLNAVASAYDPHTQYLAPADKEEFDIQMSGSLEGIGAVLSEDDHYIAVREIVPGGASWRQGKLKAGDLILAVAQEGEEPVDVADMRITPVVRMIRGPKGTVVTLTVKKPDDTIEIISITRDVVEIASAYARGAVLKRDGGKEVGYIYLPSFYGNTRDVRGGTPERTATEDVRALLKQFDKRKVGGVILDLRGNGGGLLEQARDITGMFIRTGPVVQTRYAGGQSQVLTDADPSVLFDGEVVVLVDRFSASASEILAGALQDYGRAVVVGTGPTHGKGTVQVLVDLNQLTREPGQPLGILKLTIQQFFRIDGDSTQRRGVSPDVALPDPSAHIESGERYLDNAIPWSEVEKLSYRRWSGGKWDLAALTAASTSRRGKNETFTTIEARVKYLEERRKESVVPLNREKWLAQRADDRKRLEAADPRLDEGPNRFEVAPVTYGAKDGSADKEQLKEWQKGLAHDPWVEESLHVVGDMMAAQ